MRLRYPILNLYIIILFLIMLMESSDAAEEPVKIPVDKAVSEALSNNQDYKIAVLRLEQSRQKVNEVWGQLLPDLESEISASRQQADSGAMSLNKGQTDIKFVQMRFGINPGMFYHSLEMSRSSYQLAREEVRRIRSDIEYEVIKSYFSVLLAAEMIKLRMESIELLDANFRDVQNMYRTGTVARFELLQASVRLENKKTELLQAQNNYSTELDRFNFLLGFDSVKYTVDQTVLDNPVQAVSDSGLDEKIEKLTEFALRNRPEIIQLEKKKEITAHSRDLNSSYYLWPTFSVTGYYGMTRYAPGDMDTGGMPVDFSRITGEDEWQNTWQVRVAATYRWGSLIPADESRARERAEKIRLKEAQEELKKLKRMIAISVKSNYSGLLTAYRTIKAQSENVETAREGLRISTESYRAGVIRNSELLSAELSLTTARTGHINALYSYYVAMAKLKRETGITDPDMILEENK